MTKTRLVGILGIGLGLAYLAPSGSREEIDEPPTSSGYTRGEAEAHDDFAHGRLIIKTAGQPAPWAYEYRRLLSDLYGVSVQPAAGCSVTEDLREYMAGYNAASEAQLREKFGKDIFHECRQHAERILEARRESHDPRVDGHPLRSMQPPTARPRSQPTAATGPHRPEL
jgi:hypothetical protein